LEIPAGTLDIANEDPLDAAKRELIEEMGLEAREWTLIGRFMNSPGWTNQVMTVYEARGLTEREREPAGVEERSSTIHWYSPAELRVLLRNAYAIDSTTTIALHRVFGNFLDKL
jgi:ADP-ribose pyrophosphatase